MRFAGPITMRGWMQRLRNELRRDQPNADLVGVYARHIATWAFRLYPSLRGEL